MTRPAVQTAHPSLEAHPPTQPGLPSLPAPAACQPPVLLAPWELQEGLPGRCRRGEPARLAIWSGDRAHGSSQVHPTSGSAPANSWWPGTQPASQPGPASDLCGQGRLVFLTPMATRVGSRILRRWVQRISPPQHKHTGGHKTALPARPALTADLQPAWAAGTRPGRR